MGSGLGGLGRGKARAWLGLSGFVPPFSKEYRVFPLALLEETPILCVLWHVSSHFSTSITFGISYGCLLIKYAQGILSISIFTSAFEY